MKILLILLALGLPLFAQDSSVNLQIVVFPRSADKTPLELKLGKKILEIEVASNRLTGPYKVPLLKSWTFGHRTKDAEGNPDFKILGSGKALASNNQIVVLFRKGDTNADGFNVVSYPGAPKKFGGRQFLVFNLTNQTIGGEVGKVKFGLEKGRHIIISPKSIQGQDLCHARILLKQAEKWRPLVATNWPLRDDARGLIFIYSDPIRKKIRLHAIRDFL